MHYKIEHVTAFMLCLSLVHCGCSYGLRPPELEAGHAFTDGWAEKIAKGDDATRVRNVLGDPLERTPTENGERWRYYMRVRGAEERKLFGFIPMPDSKSRNDYEVVVTFTKGVVDGVTHSRNEVR
jgi:hypothetical protein